VRAARAEERRARHLGRRRGEKFFLRFEAGQPLAQFGRLALMLHQPVGDHHGDAGRRQLALARQNDAAGLVGLADDQGPTVGWQVVEKADELVFEVGAFLLDDDYFLQAFGEAPGTFGFQRPGNADLVEADAERLGALVVDAEIFQRLARVEIGLAGGHDADARARRIDHGLVEAIDAHEGAHGVHLRSVQALFRFERRIGITDAEAARRKLEVGRHHDLDALGVDPDRRAALDRFGDRLEAHPAARVARQREAQDAEVEIFLNRRRIHDGDHRGRENLFALMRQGRGLATMVVAGQRDDATMR
jgi:hypothetical protein